MGKPSNTNPTSYPHGRALALFVLALLCALHTGAQSTRATAVPLLLPSGIAYDSAGNLYLSESSGHQVLAVSPAGVLTVYAGTGTQGYAGDGGPAIAAQLDSPGALAFSPAGDLYIADTHNHVIRRVAYGSRTISTIVGTGQPGQSPDGTSSRSAQLDLPAALAFDAAGNLFFADARSHRIRRVDAGTGLVTTVAGSGVQGFSGDGGPALLAALDTPSGLAVDATGAVFLADSHNQRIRRIDPVTHTIATIAGTGNAGFAGEGTRALAASLHLPRGLLIDASGNLLLADAQNQRIRRIDPSGSISTVAGGPVQRFAGDGAPAVAASLDTPRAVTLSPAGLLTLSDSANGRIRQIDSSANIHTVAGLGDTSGDTLSLSAPSTVTYGTGSVTAALAASSATGAITFLDTTSPQPITLASIALAGNTAVLSTAGLSAGRHILIATYPGDGLHSAAKSQTLVLLVAPAPLVASPLSVSILYGQAVPPLTATLAGLLPGDAASVVLSLASAAVPQSPPASYPITGALSGPASGNYVLTVTPANVTVSRAPALVTLGTSAGFSAHVTSTTSGTPGGSVTLLDGSQPIGVSTLSAGFATFTPALASGSHTLTAAYAGDPDFLPSSSAASIVTVNPGPAPDFTLLVAGQSSQTIPAGAAASFAFNINPVNALASAVQLAVTGLPAGSSASFNPAYIPPGGAVTSTILTIQTPHAALHQSPSPLAPLLALALPILLVSRKGSRGRRWAFAVAAACLLLATTACGDRVGTAGQATPIRSYAVVVTGTATGPSGATIQHSASVTLNVQ